MNIKKGVFLYLLLIIPITYILDLNWKKKITIYKLINDLKLNWSSKWYYLKLGMYLNNKYGFIFINNTIIDILILHY